MCAIFSGMYMSRFFFGRGHVSFFVHAGELFWSMFFWVCDGSFHPNPSTPQKNEKCNQAGFNLNESV